MMVIREMERRRWLLQGEPLMLVAFSWCLWDLWWNEDVRLVWRRQGEGWFVECWGGLRIGEIMELS